MDEMLEKIDQLPPVPNIVQDLQERYYYDDYNTSDIEQIIKRDPNLVANILKIANSPYYGLPREFIDVRQAIAYFGLEQIIEFAIASSLDQLLTFDLSFYQIQSAQFIKVSQLKSQIVRGILQDKKEKMVGSNTAFLSDISKVLISSYAKEKGVESIDIDYSLNELDEKERELFGFSTIEVTMAMFEHWNFDVLMIELLKNFKKQESAAQKALFLSRDILSLKGELLEDRIPEERRDLILKIVR